MVEDNELDRLVRASLERRADEVDPTAPVAVRARGAARRRRGVRYAALASAAAVVVVAVSAFVATQDDVDRTPADRGEDSLPVEWRTEYWRDMQVEVPADWGYGGAPVESGGLVSCYPEAAIGPDGARLEGEPTRGYVGRPIALTDICVPYPDNRPEGPQAPYVWLGAQIPTGTVDLGDGFVQETVEVNGSNLTVASDNAALRERILDSAGGGETCLSEVDQYPEPDLFPAQGSVDGACAYQRDGDAWHLTYFSELEARGAQEFIRAFHAARPTQRGGLSCDLGSIDKEFVVVMLDGQNFVVLFDHFGCPTILGTSKRIDLEPAMTRSWSRNGLQATLDYFIGPQG